MKSECFIGEKRQVVDARREARPFSGTGEMRNECTVPGVSGFFGGGEEGFKVRGVGFAMDDGGV